MPRVSKISSQKKAKRFNVFLDGKYAFSTGELSLIEFGLKQNKLISKDLIEKIVKREKSATYLDLALRQLSVRPRSEKEIVDYLQRKIALYEGIKFQEAKDSPIINNVLLKLKKYDYINDKKFTDWFVKSKLKSNPESKRLIQYKLAQKGISKEIIGTYKNRNLDDTKNAIAAVEKKAERWKKLPLLEFKKKIYHFLSYRGYDFETVQKAFAFYKEKR
ncbi:RecX family transcriptional regulator [Candidatus Curtissbacteria bacterium]|nr:RecX family transcriptional regulator [Candidatus Curtissbacteria bacterium]